MQTRKQVGDSIQVTAEGHELLTVCVTPKITDLIPHADSEHVHFWTPPARTT